MLSDFLSCYEWKEIASHLKKQIVELKEVQTSTINNMKDVTVTNIDLIKNAERVRCLEDFLDLPKMLFDSDKEKIKK